MSLSQEPASRRDVRIEWLALPGALATVLCVFVTGSAAPCGPSGELFAKLGVVIVPVMALGLVSSLVLTPLAVVKFIRAPRFNPIAIILMLLSLIPFIAFLVVMALLV